MKALSIVAQARVTGETWHLLQRPSLTCCGIDLAGESTERRMIAMVRSADLCPKCQEALAKSRVSRAGLVHKKGAR